MDDFFLQISYWWFEPYKTVSAAQLNTLEHGPPGWLVSTTEHSFSGGVFVSLAFLLLATYFLTSPHQRKATAGHFIGWTNSGLPLYAAGEDFLQKTSQSVLLFLKNALKQILSQSDSKRIFYFLCLNLAFCGVEFVYGFWTNSLGLISDGFHMFFDCSALVMGLVASVMSRWAPSRLYSYGYGRVEVLSGFINALFLVVIAFFIFVEAVERLYDPPTVLTEKLLFVSIAGLIVNLFGIFAFHGGHGHSHGGSGGGGEHGHSHGGHSHGDDAHGHHGGGGHNANMQGVFLHILADTLGSVAVIISTCLIQWFNWFWVDPLCSLGLSCLIFLSVLPLLRDSANVLLQRSPIEVEEDFQDSLFRVLQLEGVLSYSGAHLWQLKSDYNVASLHVQISHEANQQRLTQQLLNLFRSVGVNRVTVQVETDAFHQYVTSFCPSYEFAPKVSRNPVQHTMLAKAI